MFSNSYFSLRLSQFCRQLVPSSISNTHVLHFMVKTECTLFPKTQWVPKYGDSKHSA